MTGYVVPQGITYDGGFDFSAMRNLDEHTSRRIRTTYWYLIAVSSLPYSRAQENFSPGSA